MPRKLQGFPDFVVDAGTYGDDDEETSPPLEQRATWPAASPRLVQDRSVMMCWHMYGDAPPEWRFSGMHRLTRDKYLEKLQQELGVAPSLDELRPCYALVRKYFRRR